MYKRQRLLDIKETTVGSDANISLRTSTGTEWIFQNKGTGNDFELTGSNARILEIAHNSPSESIVVTSTGVGIGSAPATLFHVNSNSSSSQENFFNNDGPGAQIITLRSKMDTETWSHSRIYFDGADNQGGNCRYGTIKSYIVENTDTSENGRLSFSTVVDGVDTEYVHITSGNLGIGTATPVSYKHLTLPTKA